MIVQKEFANKPFGYGDLHALQGLQQATHFYVVQKMSF